MRSTSELALLGCGMTKFEYTCMVVAFDTDRDTYGFARGMPNSWALLRGPSQ